MARSMRSKRGRKLRAVKRIRYGEKELLRLKTMLARASEEEKPSSLATSEKVPSEGNDSATVPDVLSNDVEMEHDVAKSDFSKNQLSSKPPKYPSWLSHFKIKKLAKQERKRKHKEAKRLKKEKKNTSHQKKKKIV